LCCVYRIVMCCLFVLQSVCHLNSRQTHRRCGCRSESGCRRSPR
jgi:hypothetical protein